MIPDDYIPSVSEVEKYLSLWNELDNYVNQENALDKLFFPDFVTQKIRIL